MKTQDVSPKEPTLRAIGVEEFDSYREFFRHQVQRSSYLRGYQTQLAIALGVHPSFISQVLRGTLHLTADHAARAAEFWLLDETETEIFLCLVQLDRATSTALKKLMNARLEVLQNKKQTLSERFHSPALSAVEQEAQYYSHWLCAAVHVLLSVPAFQTPKRLAERLQLPMAAITKVLGTLEGLEVARPAGARWVQTEKNLHLGKTSPFLTSHLANWRTRALLSAQTRAPGTVHYSAIHSLSKSDAAKLRQMVLHFLDDSRKLVAPSPEEEVVCVNVDLFPV